MTKLRSVLLLAGFTLACSSSTAPSAPAYEKVDGCEYLGGTGDDYCTEKMFAAAKSWGCPYLESRKQRSLAGEDVSYTIGGTKCAYFGPIENARLGMRDHYCCPTK